MVCVVLHGLGDAHAPDWIECTGTRQRKIGSRTIGQLKLPKQICPAASLGNQVKDKSWPLRQLLHRCRDGKTQRDRSAFKLKESIIKVILEQRTGAWIAACRIKQSQRCAIVPRIIMKNLKMAVHDDSNWIL
ncbi:hypothetical protein D3C85_145330 [compost metagenome]